MPGAIIPPLAFPVARDSRRVLLPIPFGPVRSKCLFLRSLKLIFLVTGLCLFKTESEVRVKISPCKFS